jgi:hypothetical protein
VDLATSRVFWGIPGARMAFLKPTADYWSFPASSIPRPIISGVALELERIGASQMQKLGALFQHFRTFLILAAPSREAAYVDSVCQQLGEADQRILVDKFSVAKHLGEAVDQVRRKKQVIVSTTH